MIEPEISEREEEVTRVGPDGGERRTVTRTTGSAATAASRISSAVWLAVGIVDAILVLDFIFKLLAAAEVGFVGFISGLATALSDPFRGIAASSVASSHYANWPDVVGIVVYLILAAIVVGLVGIMVGRRPAPGSWNQPSA
ncbi:MAG: hypothetical protein ACRENY_03885 [Candidatus Dormibacteria bacterium]